MWSSDKYINIFNIMCFHMMVNCSFGRFANSKD